jgi:hypothetical protein
VVAALRACLAVKNHIGEFLKHPIRRENLVEELPLGDILFCSGFGDPRPEGIRIDRGCSVIRELIV